uniref:Uncharacterized protein n=1 Tax=Arundo donax TaxID=35708 RepID=A0A0A9EPB7_ARUDO
MISMLLTRNDNWWTLSGRSATMSRHPLGRRGSWCFLERTHPNSHHQMLQGRCSSRLFAHGPRQDLLRQTTLILAVGRRIHHCCLALDRLLMPIPVLRLDTGCGRLKMQTW